MAEVQQRRAERSAEEPEREGDAAGRSNLPVAVEHLPALVRDMRHAGCQGHQPGHVDRALCGRLRDSREKVGGWICSADRGRTGKPIRTCGEPREDKASRHGGRQVRAVVSRLRVSIREG